MEIDITNRLLFVFGLDCFLVGFSKGGFGGAMGFLLTPLLALVIPLNKAVGLLLPILMLADIFALAAYWRLWDLRCIRILLAGAIVGVTLATFVLVNVPAILLKKALAILVLLFITYRLLERHILALLTYRSHPWHGLLAGSAAGFASTIAHAGGPPITIYLLLQRLEPTIYIGTTALFFAILNWIKVPYYFAAGMFDFDLLFSLIWFTPLVPLGVWSGKQLATRVDKALFERMILALLMVSAILLLVE